MAYENQTHNFMAGRGLKVSVQSNETNKNKTEFFFPPGTWCDLYATTLK